MIKRAVHDLSSAQAREQFKSEGCKLIKCLANRAAVVSCLLFLSACDLGKDPVKIGPFVLDQPKGMSALQNGDTNRAIEQFTAGATSGDVESQFQLGMLYEQGRGVPVDYSQAATYYEAAASKGHPPAMMNLAGLYLRGEGVMQDYSRAANLYEKLVNMQYKPAVLPLAFMYAEGWGVSKNDSKAVALLKQAVADGNAQAQASLGLMYRQGRGVDQDMVMALALWEAAAAQGDVFAEENKNALATSLSSDEVRKAKLLGNEYFQKAQEAKAR